MVRVLLLRGSEKRVGWGSANLQGTLKAQLSVYSVATTLLREGGAARKERTTGNVVSLRSASRAKCVA